MSATRNFSRWAIEVANDPLYPRGLPKDEDTVALYVMLTEALAVAAGQAGSTGRKPAITWMPSEHHHRHYLN